MNWNVLIWDLRMTTETLPKKLLEVLDTDGIFRTVLQ